MSKNLLETVPYNLSKYHKNSKTTYYIHKNQSGLLDASPEEVIMIPPINTNIFIKSSLDKFIDQRKLKGEKVTKMPLKPLPQKYMKGFDWRIDHQDGQNDDLNKNITPVGNQYGCGCCWAFSTADAVSDVFVQSGVLSANPKCSVTYILSCSPHCNPNSICNDPNASYQCGGGQIAATVIWISQHGVASLDCQDYSWCALNNGCVNGSLDEIGLNDSLPGCPSNSDKKCASLYYIQNPQSVSVEPNTNMKNIQKQIDYIKQWIYSIGTVLGGFFVYQNLFIGKFNSDKNPDNIYLEDVDYSTHELFTPETPNKFAGGHAVCIIGWGEGKVHNSLISDDKLRSTSEEYTIVPYWIVRNSWSEKWGDKGYFKMAMYPFNKISQFDAYVTVHTDQGSGSAGGFVIFEPSREKSKTKLFNNNKDDPATRYSSISWVVIIIIIIIIAIITVLYLKSRKTRRKR